MALSLSPWPFDGTAVEVLDDDAYTADAVTTMSCPARMAYTHAERLNLNVQNYRVQYEKDTTVGQDSSMLRVGDSESVRNNGDRRFPYQRLS